jgi:hypothetical protein
MRPDARPDSTRTAGGARVEQQVVAVELDATLRAHLHHLHQLDVEGVEQPAHRNAGHLDAARAQAQPAVGPHAELAAHLEGHLEAPLAQPPLLDQRAVADRDLDLAQRRPLVGEGVPVEQRRHAAGGDRSRGARDRDAEAARVVEEGILPLPRRLEPPGELAHRQHHPLEDDHVDVAHPDPRRILDAGGDRRRPPRRVARGGRRRPTPATERGRGAEQR